MCTKSQIYKHYPIGPSRSDIIHETSKTLGIPARRNIFNCGTTKPLQGQIPSFFGLTLTLLLFVPELCCFCPVSHMACSRMLSASFLKCFSPPLWHGSSLWFVFYGSPGCMLANSDRLARVRVDRIETTQSKMKHNRIISGWMGSLIIGGSRRKMEVRSKPGGGNC